MPTLIELLEAGAHFGHKKERSHPKAKDFTFTIREGIYVIDLEKTIACLSTALEFLKKEAGLGKTILFVGTKRQAKDLIKKVAEETDMPYINQRWLGGTLTNFETIRKNLQSLENLEAKTKDQNFSNFSKKEQKVVNDKFVKLEKIFGGVRNMKNLPDIIFIIDAAKEKIAVTEGNIKEIPLVAITDTDADPEKVTFPIPANDDAPKTLEILMNLVEKAILEGKGVKKEIVKDNQKVEKPVEEKKEVKKTKKSTTRNTTPDKKEK